MKNIVMGTAGHVDHGKTSLIKALTGIDTDRLKEEKERGITIELGFAFLGLSDGRTLGIVDVPGHERFIKNMVAGAAGIDFVMLVIAADEGVMPQTREHVDICTLLGIRRGLVALTKKDMVDEDWLALVADDVRGFIDQTFLAGSPVVPVSALNGDGLPALVEEMNRIAAEVERDADAGLFRLPIDRVFTMKGFGTVVTGTLASGSIGVGDDVEIMPPGLKAKIRGIQVHNHAVETADSGQRTAINLQGIEKATIERGDVLARPGSFEVTRRIDVSFRYLETASRKLKNRTLVRFHTATSEIMARMTLLDREEVEPGDSCHAQLFLESPAVVMAGDRFVIRSYSPVTTVGGGKIVDPLPRKHKRHAPGLADELAVLDSGKPAGKAAVIIRRAGIGGIDLAGLVIRTAVHPNRLKKMLEDMFSRRQAVLLDQDSSRVVMASVYDDLLGKMIGALREYHEKFPLREGMQKEELRTTMGQYLGVKLFNMALRDMEKSGKIVIEKDSVRVAGHQVSLKGDMEDLKGEIDAYYRDAKLAAPTMREMTEKFSDRKKQALSVMNVMLREGTLVKISEDLCYHRDVIAELRENYKGLLVRDGKATPASFKDLTGLTRKFIIPLMEYFDMTKLTIRAGEHRVLRERDSR